MVPQELRCLERWLAAILTTTQRRPGPDTQRDPSPSRRLSLLLFSHSKSPAGHQITKQIISDLRNSHTPPRAMRSSSSA